MRDARRAMGAAADALARGDLTTAQALQERAIEALDEGAEAIRAARGEPGGGGDARAGRGVDPLGRAYGQPGASGVEIPGLSDPERVREVLETLRRRVADPTLSPEERAYIEGLLERF